MNKKHIYILFLYLSFINCKFNNPDSVVKNLVNILYEKYVLHKKLKTFYLIKKDLNYHIDNFCNITQICDTIPKYLFTKYVDEIILNLKNQKIREYYKIIDIFNIRDYIL